MAQGLQRVEAQVYFLFHPVGNCMRIARLVGVNEFGVVGFQGPTAGKAQHQAHKNECHCQGRGELQAQRTPGRRGTQALRRHRR